MAERQQRKNSTGAISVAGYDAILADVAGLLDAARRTSARAVNAVMTATYWQIGRRIVEFEQGGKAGAKYGEAVLARLADDLTSRFGRGFSKRNLEQMRRFYLSWPIAQTSSAQLADGADSRPNSMRADIALEGLPNKVLAGEYRTVLPDERTLAAELNRTRRLLERGGGVAERKRRHRDKPGTGH